MPDNASTGSAGALKASAAATATTPSGAAIAANTPRAMRSQPSVGLRKHQGETDQSDLPAEVHDDTQQQIQPPTGSVQDLAYFEIGGPDDAVAQQTGRGQEDHPHRHVVGLAEQQEDPDELEDDAEQEDAPAPQRQRKAAGLLGDSDLDLASGARHQVADRLFGGGVTVNARGAPRGSRAAPRRCCGRLRPRCCRLPGTLIRAPPGRR